MKLQLTVPTGFIAEPLAEGQLRYVIPRGASPVNPEGGPAGESGGGRVDSFGKSSGGDPAGDSVLLVRESLPLPLELESWPLAALSRLKQSRALLPALPTALAAVPAATAEQWRVQVHSTRALSTASGWPATLVHATMGDGRDQPLFNCIAALYRFLSFGAEAIFLSADRVRFSALREPLLNVLATGRPVWPRGEPPSIHHMLYDEPQSP